MRGGGVVLTHRVEGTGEPVLLLNGGMMTMSSWDPIVPTLAAQYRVIRCDLRGQLLSPGPAPADLAGHVDEVVALLDQRGVDSCHVVGTSFGGLVGLMLAATRSGRVRSLVATTVADHIEAATADGARWLREACREALAGGDRGLLFRRLLSVTYSESFLAPRRAEMEAREAQTASLPDTWFEGVDAILRALETMDLRPFLRRIACPTLVVVAGQDRILPPERGRAVAAAIPGARLEEIPESGHALVVEHAGRLADLCLQFIAEVERPRSSEPPARREP